MNLVNSKKGIIIYGYDSEKWPLDPAIEAFEFLALRNVKIINREEASFKELIHPFHKSGKVFGWEIKKK